MSDAFVVIFLGLLACGIIAGQIAGQRGATNTGAWFLAGFFLGPIGILLSLAHRTAECSACRKRIHPNATRCPHCQAELSRALRPSR